MQQQALQHQQGHAHKGKGESAAAAQTKGAIATPLGAHVENKGNFQQSRQLQQVGPKVHVHP